MDIQMEMPTPCVNCNEIFDLTDGFGSKKWFPNTIICESCYNEEKQEIEKEEEIADWLEMKENALYDIDEAETNLQRLGYYSEVIKDDTSFEDAMKIARADFCSEVRKQKWNTEMRTVCDDILIVFDVAVQEVAKQKEHLKKLVFEKTKELEYKLILTENLLKDYNDFFETHEDEKETFTEWIHDMKMLSD